MTDVIRQVSDLVYDNDYDDDTRHGASMLWRMQSGHAHATPSARIRQIDRETLTRNADGSLTGTATANFGEVGLATSVVVLWLMEAWRLYDLRREPA